MKVLSICRAVWNRRSYVLSSVTWGFITKTTTLIGTFAEEPIEGESWRLRKVQLTRLPLRCSLLKATDKTHYTAAASWNVTPSIDQMASLPSSTVTSHNHCKVASVKGLETGSSRYQTQKTSLIFLTSSFTILSNNSWLKWSHCFQLLV